VSWVPIAVVTAVGFAASNSYAKALSDRAHLYVVTWCLIALSAPWSGLLLLRQGVPTIGNEFLLAALVSVAVNMVAVTLQVRALSLSPLSLTVPFLAFTPLFMLLPSWVVLRETPDALGLTGILLIVAGGYAMHIDKVAGGPLAPIRAIAKEKGSVLMLAVAAMWSISAVFDKVATLASSPACYSRMVLSVVLGCIFFKEKHLRVRFAGAALMALGVAVLSLEQA